MLVNFRFTNFLSVDQLTEFSMTPGRVKKHENHLIPFDQSNSLLKFSALYGANASGKSTFFKAISYSQSLIINGLTDDLVISTSYNRNNQKNRDKVTNFEYEISIDDKIYSYGFSILLSKRKFVQEWLYDITNQETIIYMIDKSQKHYEINQNYLNISDSFYHRLQVYFEDNLFDHSQLILYALNNGKKVTDLKEGKIFHTIYHWFLNHLEVIGPGQAAKEAIPNLIMEAQLYQEQLANYLANNDTGIQSLFREPVEALIGVPATIQERIFEELRTSDTLEKISILKTNARLFIIEYKQNNFLFYELKFKHQNGTVYSLFEESDGTVRLIEIYSVIYNTSNKVFVIDEIDRSLHPLLTYNFVESFLNQTNNSQLIVTTHEDILLNLQLLRRDEIWFVEKNQNGNSTLYSLENFKERFDKNILNAYLDGRYGAVPTLRNLFSEVNDTTKEV